MTPYDLGKATCVCRKWRYTIRNPVFWRIACLKAWQVKLNKGFEYGTFTAYKSFYDYGASFVKLSGIVENYKILQSKYDGSWRKMWLLRPRVRTDGKSNRELLHSYLSCSSY